MSNLMNSLSSFQKSQADATRRNLAHARPAAATPARVSTPKPAADTTKRSHDSAFANTSAASTTTAMTIPGGAVHAGHELLTNVNFAKKYLKEKHPQSKTFEDIMSYLSLPTDADKNRPFIRQALMQDPAVEVIPKGSHGNKQMELKYRPKVPVSNPEELCMYLARLDSAGGVAVNDIKDGWPDCVSAINKLAQEGSVLVSRGKDDIPKHVYADSPNFHIHVDQDFRDFWLKTKIPGDGNEVRSDLEKAGITPTSHVKEIKHLNVKKPKKKPTRRGGKITNTHMTGVLKDYTR